MRILIALGFVLSATAAHAQTWEELQAVPANTEVRIEETGRRGGHATGLMQAVEHAQLTIAKGNNQVAIPRARIGKVQTQTRDPIWEGVLIGFLATAIPHFIFRGEPSTTAQTVRSYAIVMAGGALIDWGNKAKRTVYQAP